MSVLLGVQTLSISASKTKKDTPEANERWEEFKHWWTTVGAALVEGITEIDGLGPAIELAAGLPDFACATWLLTANKALTNLSIQLADPTIDTQTQITLSQKYQKLTTLRDKLMQVCKASNL